MQRLVAVLALIAGSVMAGATPCVAQDFPTRPIRTIAATSAGGTSDIFMRVLGEELQKRWGQPIVIENRPAETRSSGGARARRRANDGYTICIVPGEVLAFNQVMFKKLALRHGEGLRADHQSVLQHLRAGDQFQSRCEKPRRACRAR